MKNQNLFDQHLDGYDDDQLDGMFSFIEKGIKKVVKKTRDVNRKIRGASNKLLPKSLRKVVAKVDKVGRKLDEKGITKIAAGIALSFVAGPAVFGAISGALGGGAAGAAAGAIKTGVGLIAKSGIAKGLATSAATTFIKGKINKKQQAAYDESLMVAEQHQANLETEAALKTQTALNKAIAQSPKFAQVVQEARAQGYDDDQILQHWVESKSFYNVAVPEVVKAVQPQIYSEARQQGFSQEFAQDYSVVKSAEIADKTVKETQQQYGSSNNLMLPLAIGAMTLLLK